MKTGRFLLFATLALLTVFSRPATAQISTVGLVTTTLEPDTTVISPGKPFTVGVHLKLKSGWHTYWQFTPDSGLPTKITWDLPEGFKAGPIQWPIPESRLDDPDLLTFIYSDEAFLLVEITPPAQLPANEVTLHAKVKWQACARSCVLGNSTPEVKISTAGQPAPANAEIFAKWRALLPRTEAPPFQVQLDRTKAEEFSLKVTGLAADEKVEFFPLPAGDAKPGHPAVGAPAADGSRTITVPITDGPAANLPWSGVIVTQKSGAERVGWAVSSTAPAKESPPAGVGAPPKSAQTTEPPKSAADSSSAAASAPETPPARTTEVVTTPLPQSQTFLGVLGLSFLGGLILNIMPCVLPVIALKIFGFVKQAGEDPRRVFHLGLAFVAGVFTFFLGLAVSVIALKAAGRGFNWGFQFQNPYVFAGLIALVFVFGLNLLGVFEVALSSGAATKLSALSGKEGFGGAFLHGMFTTLLGTSCTAPFLSASLGYATTQSPVAIIAIFLAIAAGMSLPYFILTAKPAWLRYLPKPGMWMERAKQLMGFIMLGVAVWLLGVFAETRPQSAAGLIHYLLVLGLACWLFGIIGRRGVAGAVVIVLAVGGYFACLQGPLQAQAPQARAGAASFDQEVAEGLKSGRPVFIDFTAEWCVNCKVFEHTVLDSDRIQAAMKEKNVLALKGDWTNGDPAISAWLQKFNRIGVPVYVLYRPGEKVPVVMDALTQQGLLAELNKIGKVTGS